MKINSVNGPIESGEMGKTLIHEHLLTINYALYHAYGKDWLDEEEMYRIFCERVERVKAKGVRTIVDPLPTDLGRDLRMMQEASKRAGINYICATGLYHVEAPFMSKGIDPDYLASYFIKDLTEGIEGTEYKAALIKVATDKMYGMSENNRKMMEAAAIASIATGVPITTHTYSKEHHGLYQQQIFLDKGVEPKKIYIGHSFDCLDKDYLREIMDKGSYVGCDQIGITHRASTEDLAKCVADLIHMDKGYEKQIFLSHDGGVINDYGSCFMPWRRDVNKNSSCGSYDELFDVMIPELLKNGISEEIIDIMLIDNPRRYFEGRDINE